MSFFLIKRVFALSFFFSCKAGMNPIISAPGSVMHYNCVYMSLLFNFPVNGEWIVHVGGCLT